MNFGEIYDSVVFNVWGDSVPPTGSVARLQGESGIIANMHRDIQTDYNYWFMESWAEIDSIVGNQGYDLPANYKEIINCMWQVLDTDATDPYFTDPLNNLSLRDAHLIWKDNNQRDEYPENFQIRLGMNLILYPIPSEIRRLVVVYNRYLDRPATATFSADTDDLTQYGAEAIISLSTAKMFRILQELNMSSTYDAEARRYIELLKREDFRRRQSLMNKVDYVGV